MPTSHPARSPSFRASLRHLVWRACSSRARTPPSQGTRRCAPAPYRSAPAPDAAGAVRRGRVRGLRCEPRRSAGFLRAVGASPVSGERGRHRARSCGSVWRRGDARTEATTRSKRWGSSSFSLALSSSASDRETNATRRRRSRRRRAVRRRRERRRPGAIRRGRAAPWLSGARGGVASRGACWRWTRGAERSTRRGENAPNRFRTVHNTIIRARSSLPRPRRALYDGYSRWTSARSRARARARVHPSLF